MALTYPLFTAILIKMVSANWTVLQSGDANLPAHVYSFHLNQGQKINGSLSWQVRTDLDIYIFLSGSNLLNNSNSVASFLLFNERNQPFIYTASTTSTYFLKVHGYDLFNNVLVTYTLTWEINGITTVSQEIICLNSLRSIAILIPNSLTVPNIAFKYQSNTTNNKAILTTQLGRPSVNLNPNETPCIINSNQINYFVLLIRTNGSAAISLTPTSYNLQYDEVSDENKQCLSLANKDADKDDGIQNSPGKTKGLSIGSIITLSVVIPICFVGILIPIGLCICRKYTNYQKQVRIEQIQNSKAIKQLNSSEIDLKQEQNCCICLGNKCDSSLPCHHQFHENCIKQWMRKNNACPLCRASIL